MKEQGLTKDQTGTWMKGEQKVPEDFLNREEIKTLSNRFNHVFVAEKQKLSHLTYDARNIPVQENIESADRLVSFLKENKAVQASFEINDRSYDLIRDPAGKDTYSLTVTEEGGCTKTIAFPELHELPSFLEESFDWITVTAVPESEAPIREAPYQERLPEKAEEKEKKEAALLDHHADLEIRKVTASEEEKKEIEKELCTVKEKIHHVLIERSALVDSFISPVLDNNTRKTTGDLLFLKQQERQRLQERRMQLERR